MLEPVLASTATTSIALLFLERNASRLGLMEKPGGHRTHLDPTPVVGGIGMALGMLLSWGAWRELNPGPWIIVGAFALLSLGLVDDRFGIGPRAKFVLQSAIAGIALALDNNLLLTLGELLPGHHFSFGFAAALGFTVFAAAGVINGMNMLDGLDGLAGSIALVAVAWFSFAAWWIGDLPMMLGQLSIAGAIAGFLLFNARIPGRARARLFMGDAGSMVLGFLLAWIAIDLSQRPGGLPPVVALWICAMPVIDTIAVMAKRKRKKCPLMSAGRDHLHHLLVNTGMSVRSTAAFEALIGAIAGGLGVTMWLIDFAHWQMFAAFLAAACAYLYLFLAGWNAHRASEAVEMRIEPAVEAAGTRIEPAARRLPL
ncbi:MAG: undecaprenyl/decaprenyl-phosphate alpha-N-acetylglucosaminyl 1-phosphate transferase [Burkholderiaceae bacterium]|nr:undecaprenyl/decaprenyl-phosphate alpha-N-acetylglucosaminyl 1-phosphate transferase [Burkholderiaceae bacterium]